MQASRQCARMQAGNMSRVPASDQRSLHPTLTCVTHRFTNSAKHQTPVHHCRFYCAASHHERPRVLVITSGSEIPPSLAIAGDSLLLSMLLPCPVGPQQMSYAKSFVVFLLIFSRLPETSSWRLSLSQHVASQPQSLCSHHFGQRLQSRHLHQLFICRMITH